MTLLSGVLNGVEYKDVPQFIVRDGDIQVAAEYWGPRDTEPAPEDDSGYYSKGVTLVVTTLGRNVFSFILNAPTLSYPPIHRVLESFDVDEVFAQLLTDEGTEIAFYGHPDDLPVHYRVLVVLELSQPARDALRVWLDMLYERGILT